MADLQRAVVFPILIPLGTTAPSSRRTFATYTLIAISFFVFLAGFRSALVSQALAFYTNDDWYRYLTYAFVHESSWSGLAHLCMNMFFLWIFGSPLETRMGWWRFILLYLACAAAGAAVWDLFQSLPNVKLIGSSGAVWGLIGSYLILWPFSSVICYFVLTALFFPFYATTYHALAVFFPIVYYVLAGLIYFMAWRFDIKLPFGPVAWLAHLGGIAAGLGLTAAFYGFHGFTIEADEEESLQRKLQLRIDRQRLGFAPDGPKVDVAEPRPVKPMSARLMPLHEAVVNGDRERAVKLWHELLKPAEGASLLPGPQMDLARILIREGETGEATEALERLVKAHPECELATMARFELATLLVDAAEFARAAAFLRQIESNAPLDLSREIKQLRRRIPDPFLEEPAAPRASTELFEPGSEETPGSPTIDDFIRAAGGGPSRSADSLFGNPEDTDAFKMQVGKDAPPQSRHRLDQTTPPIFLDAEEKKANELFGDPNDTDAFKMNTGKEIPLQPGLIHEDTTPPAMLEAEEARAKDLFGDPEDTGSFQMNVKPDAPRSVPLTRDQTDPPILFDTDPGEAAPPPDPRPARGSEPLEAAGELFGNPEDTGAFEMNMKPDAPRLKPLTRDDTRPPIMLDTNPDEAAPPPDPRPARGSEPDQPAPSPEPLAPIFLDDDDLLSVPPPEEKAAEPSPKPWEPRPAQPEPAAPEPKPRPEKFIFRSSILPKHEIKQPLAPVQSSINLEPLDIQLERLKTSITPASGPSPEVFIGDITNFSPQPETSDTHDKRLVLRRGVKYAAILTPGCPVDIPLVCAAIAPVLGLSPDGTHHALLRRRGILAEDLTASEAEALAKDLSANGQSVSVVACDDQLEFGPPQDVLTYSDEGASARFSISNEALTCRWSQAVFFAAGLVRLDPTAPGRALIDLFFAQPRAHLRIWENTFVYPDRVVVAAKGMENQRQSDSDHGFLRREWCFRSMAAEIDTHGRNAVRTRSFSSWLDLATPLPTAHFWSLIEYENFLRWHLMAYHVPKKKFEAKK
ncbi:MAG: rhomboid family intramembrane serine protease [Candidatus Sumerlaeia bacterium]